jgi:hypothetical protein
MSIYEIKDPQPPLQPETPRRESTPPVDGVRPVVRIRHYEGGRREGEGKKGHRPGSLPPAQERELRQLVDRVNRDLERQKIPIHLILIAAGEGFLLEVYDCTDRQVCRAVRDLEISAADLPGFLLRLQGEAGLLVDVFS